MKTIEDIALEVGSKHPAFDQYEFTTAELHAFLAAVDAERGKDAVAWMYEGLNGRITFYELGTPHPMISKPLFLSPTIPPNMALVPIPSTSKMDWAGVDAVGLDEFRATDAEKCFNAMIQAAGVTK